MNGYEARIDKLKGGTETARWAARKIGVQKREIKNLKKEIKHLKIIINQG